MFRKYHPLVRCLRVFNYKAQPSCLLKHLNLWQWNSNLEEFLKWIKFLNRRRNWIKRFKFKRSAAGKLFDLKSKFKSALCKIITPISNLCYNHQVRLVRLLEHEFLEWWNCLDTRFLTEKVESIMIDKLANEPYK
jgi:hypothetical protein